MQAEQLCFDVPRPLQSRPRRSAKPPPRQHSEPPAGEQMELHMVPAAAEAALPVRREQPSAGHTPESFAEWLLGQSKQPGMVGELARAARLDHAFPRRGGVGAVRMHLCRTGADGDVFVALEDAERVFDRC